MVIHDIECPYWDQISLNNTNQTKQAMTVNFFKYRGKIWHFNDRSKIVYRWVSYHITEVRYCVSRSGSRCNRLECCLMKPGLNEDNQHHERHLYSGGAKHQIRRGTHTEWIVSLVTDVTLIFLRVLYVWIYWQTCTLYHLKGPHRKDRRLSEEIRRNKYWVLTRKVLNFWKFTSYCSLKPLWLGMGEVVPARTSPTLHPPSPPTVHQLSWLALLKLICCVLFSV